MPRRICLRCGSNNTASIFWGMPAFDEELQKKLDNKEIVLGGCCITDCDPTHHCNKCKKDFSAPTTEAETETTKVRFSVGGYFDGYPVITVIKTANGALAECTPSRTTKPRSAGNWLPMNGFDLSTTCSVVT